jgi:hypothetical protein
MRDRSRHYASEWTHESPMRVSPHAFDALCRVLGRTVAQSMQQHSAALPAALLGSEGGKSPDTPENVRALPYQWAARHLLTKMGLEAR